MRPAMLTYPDIDPILVSLGPLKVHWYGIMYLLGFIAAWGLGRWRGRRPESLWPPERVDDVIFYCIVGVIAGGRLGYMLFYGFEQILANPLNILKVWEGGMSFHGGLIGVILAMMLFGHRHRLHFFQVADFIAPLIPPGLMFGRLGNFINGELWGQRTDVPWGMQLPCTQFPRACVDQPPDTLLSPAVHPSQLYEASLEGLTLFLILWIYSSRPRPMMAVSGLFLVLYGTFRIIIEFVRIPDVQLGYLAFGWLTMGQVLSIPMIVFGALFIALAYRRRAAAAD
jgi:phosphatidylglycerol---prolipoprotein diacylglyceryl transferase